ncbi:hypothetical protein L3Y34_010428 [Caenorhabditis briggsae]|uniref:Uncharacterized protein n=1 Tax=Caenorhabditis briggsae TaxID=6238 RepID=A0AAE9CTB8_CAEBR|nr:hypothetical protein L3Y34_010428 [Caenorhabditis briggsae]
MPRYTPGSFVIVRRSYRLNLSAWYTPYIYGTPQLGRFDVKLVLLPSVRRIRILPSSTAAIPARPGARIPAAPVLPATIAPVATQHATQKTPGTQAYTPGSFVIVRRSYRLNLSAWYTPYIYGTPQLGRFDVKLVLLPSVRRIRILPSSTAAIPARPRARIPAAPVLPATIAPVTTQHATQKTPGTQAIPLAASNQNTIPSVVGPPVIPVQQLGVPAASSAPLSVPAVLPAPRGPLNTPASNAMAALSAPAIPLQAVASPVPPTQPDQQGIPISIPAGLIPSSAPIQPAAGPPQTPQVAFAAPPETDNDPPMLEFQPPFENDYYGHNGSDPEKEDLWENVHFYGPGVYRLIDPLCPDLTKEQAQAAQKVWDTVQAYMRDIVQQGPEDLLN